MKCGDCKKLKRQTIVIEKIPIKFLQNLVKVRYEYRCSFDGLQRQLDDECNQKHYMDMLNLIDQREKRKAQVECFDEWGKRQQAFNLKRSLP